MSEEHAAADAHAAPVRRVEVDDYRAAGDLLRAVTAPIRLAIVDLLADGPLCVHELVDALAVPQPLVAASTSRCCGPPGWSTPTAAAAR